MMKRLLCLVFVITARLSAAQSAAVIVPSPVPSCSNGDYLQWSTSAVNFVCTATAAAAQPLTDLTAIVKNTSDATKLLKFNVAAITTATTRTWTIPDANITVPSTIASLAANTFTDLQTANGGVASTTGTFSSTLSVTGNSTLSGTGNTVGTITSGTWNAGAVTSTGAFTGTSFTISSSGNVLPTVRTSTANAVGIEFYQSGVDTWGFGIGPGDGTDTFNLYSPVAAQVRFKLTSAGALRLSGYGAGTATFDASGNITSVSDERMKNINGQFTVGLNALLGVHPILYHYKDGSGLDTENAYAGFSAQNVLRYIPEAVGKNLDGFYSLNIVPILAATVTAIQELAIEVDQLRAAAKLPSKNRNLTPVTDEKRVINSATPKRLAQVAKDRAEAKRQKENR